MVLVLKERELGDDRAIALLGPKPITCLRDGVAWGDRILWPGDDRFGMRSLGCC